MGADALSAPGNKNGGKINGRNSKETSENNRNYSA